MSDSCVNWIVDDIGCHPTYGVISDQFCAEIECDSSIAKTKINEPAIDRLCHYAGRGWRLVEINSEGIHMRKSGFAS